MDEGSAAVNTTSAVGGASAGGHSAGTEAEESDAAASTSGVQMEETWEAALREAEEAEAAAARVRTRSVTRMESERDAVRSAQRRVSGSGGSGA